MGQIAAQVSVLLGAGTGFSQSGFELGLLGHQPGQTLVDALQLDADVYKRQQYRSGIYFHDEAQAGVAREVLAELQQTLGGRVVTELQQVTRYTRAEDYHQHYFANHPGQGYCAFVVAPKLEKFRRSFAARYRP